MPRQDARFQITIPGSARGLPDRDFEVTVSEARGITVRLRGGHNPERTLRWRDLMCEFAIRFGGFEE